MHPAPVKVWVEIKDKKTGRVTVEERPAPYQPNFIEAFLNKEWKVMKEG